MSLGKIAYSLFDRSNLAALADRDPDSGQYRPGLDVPEYPKGTFRVQPYPAAQVVRHHRFGAERAAARLATYQPAATSTADADMAALGRYRAGRWCPPQA
jgi:hypothetical protein